MTFRLGKKFIGDNGSRLVATENYHDALEITVECSEGYHFLKVRPGPYGPGAYISYTNGRRKQIAISASKQPFDFIILKKLGSRSSLDTGLVSGGLNITIIRSRL